MNKGKNPNVLGKELLTNRLFRLLRNSATLGVTDRQFLETTQTVLLNHLRSMRNSLLLFVIMLNPKRCILFFNKSFDHIH